MTAVTALSLAVALLLGARAEACTITPVPAMRVHVGFPVNYTATNDGTCGGLYSWVKISGPAEFSLDGAGGLFYWTPAAVGSPAITIGIIDVATNALLASTSFTPVVDDNSFSQPLWRDYLSRQTAVPILGRAHGSDFVSYILEAAPTATPLATTRIVGPVTTPLATTGTLGTWDISAIPDGARYTLTLRVQLTDGTESVLSDQVIIDRSARAGWPKRIGPITHSPVVTDLGDGQKSVLVVTHFGELYRFKLDGTQVFKTVNYGATYSAPSVGVLGGSTAIVWATDTNIYAHRPDETLVPGFPIAAPSTHEFRTVLTLADIDGDGNLEILVGAMGLSTSTPARVYAYRYANGVVSLMPGWPQAMNHSTMYASVSVGDLDGDGRPELVAGNYDRVYAWHADGTLVSGFPATLARPITGTQSTGGGSFASSSQSALADLDGDGKLEIIIGSNVRRWDGSEQPGWVGGKAGAVDALSPAVARTPSDGLIVVLGSQVWRADGTPLRTLGAPGSAVGSGVITAIGEVVAGIRDSSPPGITAFGTTGAVLSRYPKSLYGSPGDESAPVVDDFDGLGFASVAVAITDASYGGIVALYDTDWAYVEGKDWPMLGQNVQHTGLFEDSTPPTTPSNPMALPASGTQINLSWTASADYLGVTGYQVERCQGAACTNFAPVTTVTGTTYNNTGLLQATSYSYRVRATDAAGNLSAYSNIASATTQATLTVTKAGTGSGTVTSSPAGINCGSACSAAYNFGTMVTLTASPNSDSLFAGWGNACSGTGSCAVTMNAARSATATFNQYITVTVPNGGESWTRGSKQTIRWTYAGNPGSSVKIELLKGGALNGTITSSVSRGSNGNGSYSWRISSTQATGSDYTIRITSTSNSNYKDTSNGNFTIR